MNITKEIEIKLEDVRYRKEESNRKLFKARLINDTEQTMLLREEQVLEDLLTKLKENNK